MSKQEKINNLFIQNLSNYLNKNLPVKDTLITVKEVKLANDLSQAEVKVSILPINLSGSTLSLLRKSSKEIAFFVAKRMKLRKVPRLIWKIDSSEEKFTQLNKLFDQINKEKN